MLFGGEVANGDVVRRRGSNWWSDKEGDRARLFPDALREWLPAMGTVPELTDRIVELAIGVREGGDPGDDAILSGEEGRATLDLGDVRVLGEGSRRCTGV